MRLATFNILHGQPVLGAVGGQQGTAGGMPRPGTNPEEDNPVRADDLAGAVAELEADILGMQEVDSHQPRSGLIDQTLVAARAVSGDDVPADRLFVPVVAGTPGARATFDHADDEMRRRSATGPDGTDGPLYGVSLISRLPVLSWHHTVFGAPRISLPLLIPARPRPRLMSVPDEPRAAIAAVVRGSQGPVTVATAHLSFVPGVNVSQLRRLRQWLESLPRPLVLMGDFNLPGGLPQLVTGWPQIVAGPTYPSFGPRIRFDHILLDGVTEEVVDRARRSVRILPLAVSDHCAVVADIDL